MTDANWRALRRSELWERLCRLTAELYDLKLLW